MPTAFVHRVEVRFRDCDPMGHVNNAVYFTYLEQARFAHWRALWGFGAEEVPRSPGVILARVECDFKAQVRYGDFLDVQLTVSAMGRTSFTYEYQVLNGTGRLVASAKSVQVMFDYGQGTAVPIPDDVRRLLSR